MRTRPWPLLALPLLALTACGDDGGRDSAGESATASSSGASASGTATTAGGESASATAATQGSASDSATTSTSGATESTSASASASGSTTGSTTDTGTGSTTGDVPGFCSEDPPPGFQGMFNADCKTPPKVGTFTPVTEWHKATWTMAPAVASSASAPIAVQLTDDNADGKITPDDMPDLVFISYSGDVGALRAISGDGQTEIFSVASGLDRNKAVAAADIDGDGIVEIITSNTSKQILAFEHDGTKKWTSMALGANVGAYEVAPAISDMNGDGTPEIVVGRAILDNQGNLLGAGTHGVGASDHANGSASMSFAVDVDGDGDQEVVVGNALYNIAGADIWFNGLSDGYPAVGDFDLDGTPEIVVVSTGKVRLQSSVDGKSLWSINLPGGLGGPPTIADFDGDTLPEIGIAGQSRYSVIEGDGTVLWTNVTQDGSSGITGSAVYDFEGDGIADVVYADETNLWIYAGNDGAVKLKFEPHNSGTRLEYPIIADVDGDDQVEIAFVSEPYNGNYSGITVIGDADNSWTPGRKIWNQHAYHITNVKDDGTIPPKADQNWKFYNNFRSGDLAPPDGGLAPDLKVIGPDSCFNECQGADKAQIWVQLGNAGSAPLVAGAIIQVYATVMGVESLVQEIPFDQLLQPGEYAAAIPIVVDTKDVEKIRIVASPKEPECFVDPADELVLEAPFCAVPG